MSEHWDYESLLHLARDVGCKVTDLLALKADHLVVPLVRWRPEKVEDVDEHDIATVSKLETQW